MVLLGSRDGQKVSLALGVTPDLVERFQAGALIQEIAASVGGSGGGRPDFAQAGGSEPDGLPAALERLAELLEA